MSEPLFVLYTWISTAAWYVLILVLAFVPGLDLSGNQTDWLLRSTGYALLYGMLFLLMFRAMLATVRAKVGRLMHYKSRREKAEDTEFAHLTELLLFVIAMLTTLMLGIADEYLQSKVAGRIGDAVDVLFVMLGILLVTLLIYKVPLVTELESLLFNKKSETPRETKKSKV